MIVKHEKFKYRVSYVKEGHGWTKFNVGDYDKKTKKSTYVTVFLNPNSKDEPLSLNLQDGDEIIFKDYLVGFHTYNGNVQPTLTVREQDIEVVSMANDGNTLEISSDDLPF